MIYNKNSQSRMDMQLFTTWRNFAKDVNVQRDRVVPRKDRIVFGKRYVLPRLDTRISFNFGNCALIIVIFSNINKNQKNFNCNIETVDCPRVE